MEHRMRILLAILGPLLLTACNTPSAEFQGIEPQIVNVAQSTFEVRVNGNAAEALRTNSEYSPSMSYVADRATTAIEHASGCTVLAGSLSGDPAMVRADLSCP